MFGYPMQRTPLVPIGLRRRLSTRWSKLWGRTPRSGDAATPVSATIPEAVFGAAGRPDLEPTDEVTASHDSNARSGGGRSHLSQHDPADVRYYEIYLSTCVETLGANLDERERLVAAYKKAVEAQEASITLPSHQTPEHIQYKRALHHDYEVKMGWDIPPLQRAVANIDFGPSSSSSSLLTTEALTAQVVKSTRAKKPLLICTKNHGDNATGPSTPNTIRNSRATLPNNSAAYEPEQYDAFRLGCYVNSCERFELNDGIDDMSHLSSPDQEHTTQDTISCHGETPIDEAIADDSATRLSSPRYFHDRTSVILSHDQTSDDDDDESSHSKSVITLPEVAAFECLDNTTCLQDLASCHSTEKKLHPDHSLELLPELVSDDNSSLDFLMSNAAAAARAKRARLREARAI